MTLLNDHSFLNAFPFLDLTFAENGVIDPEYVARKERKKKNELTSGEYDQSGTMKALTKGDIKKKKVYHQIRGRIPK